jgi:hypothetical protein
LVNLLWVPHGVLPAFLIRHQEDHLDHSVQWIVWQGPASDEAEALQSAEKADPRIDLEWMRIRYERDLNKR